LRIGRKLGKSRHVAQIVRCQAHIAPFLATPL
jgi:hypothetical protein